MQTIALVTDAVRGIWRDDASLPAAFGAIGLAVEFVDWGRPIAWDRFAAAVLRTPWDYHERYAEFAAWLSAVPVPVWNPPSVVRWNARKTYLLDLLDHGLPVIPTRILDDRGLAPHLADWGRVVVKPEIGGGGAFTFLVDRPGLDLPTDRRFVVQPFDPAIADGEWSLVYFDGAFSHAVRKVAAPGEFRIHEEHGGRVEAAVAPPALREVAARFATCAGILPYARVDLVGDGARARLVELELIEPELFFTYSDDGPARFARAVAARLDTGPTAP